MVHEQSDYVIYGGISILASSASNIFNFFHIHRYINITSVELDDPRKVSLKIDDYLFGVLGMDTEQASNEKRELIKDKKNLIRSWCVSYFVVVL